MPRWDLVYKWADPETRSIVDAVTSALENCDRKLTEAPAGRSSDPEPIPGSVRVALDAAKAVADMPPTNRGFIERWQHLRAALRAIPALQATGEPTDDEFYVEPPSPKIWEGLPKTRWVATTPTCPATRHTVEGDPGCICWGAGATGEGETS